MIPNNSAAETKITLSSWQSISLITFTLLQIIIGSVSNGAVIYTFLVARELRKRPSDLLILNLAVADFISLVTFLPFHAFVIIKGGVGCGFRYFLYESLNTMGTYSSGNTIFSIAVDKFLAVVSPLRYKTLITRNVVFLFITFSWTVAVLVGILNFLSFVFSFNFQFLFLCVSHPVLLLLATTVLYCVIFCCTIKQGKRILKQRRNVVNELTGHPTINHYRLTLKATLNSLMLVFLFHGTFLPLLVYVTHFSLAKKVSNSNQLTERIWIYSFLFVNACIDPFIYTCGTKTFKKAFRRNVWSKIVIM